MLAGALAAVLALLFASAALSAAETAVFALSSRYVRTLFEEGYEGAEALQTVHAEPAPFRGALLFCIVLLNVTCAGIVVAVSVLQWGTTGAFISIPSAALAALLFAEFLPRLLAARTPVRLALSAAPLLLSIERIVRPALAPFRGLEGMLERQDEPGSSEERQLREITELGAESGVVDADEGDLVARAFRLDELTAWDVMTPRVKLFAWDESLRLADIADQLQSVSFSRVPIYQDTVDEVTGVLYLRDAYNAYLTGHTDVRLSQLAREPLYVPGSLSLTRLLRDFQARRIHMGIVADEFGGTDGIVTLEDVLEELVGEIHDETDVDDEPIVRIGRHEVAASGDAELREVNHILKVTLPHLEHRTLNGFLLDYLGRVPEVEEKLRLDDCEITVVSATETQVLRARIRQLLPSDLEAVPPLPEAS